MARKTRAVVEREYQIGATLVVRADSHTRAKQLASAALMRCASTEVVGAFIDREARLFDASAFEQIPGQLGMETDPDD